MLFRSHTTILVGSGVTPDTIQTLHDLTGATAFHLSGKQPIKSSMTYRNDQVSMGFPILSEYIRYETSSKIIKEARNILDQLTT